MAEWFLFKISSVTESPTHWFATAEIKTSPSLKKLSDVSTIQFELGDEALPVPSSEFVEVNLAPHLFYVEDHVLHVSEWKSA